MLAPVSEKRHPGGKEGRAAEQKRFKEDPLSYGTEKRTVGEERVKAAQATQRGEKR